MSVNIVNVAYPVSALMKSRDPNWSYGDPITAGDFAVTNCYGGFDPSTPGGVSNFGTGFEPGWDGTAPSGNNCINHSIAVRLTPGSFGKAYATYLGRNANDTTQGSHSPCYTDSNNPYPFGPIGVSSCRAGDGFTTPGATGATWAHLDNGANLAPMNDVRACDVWDNSVQNIRQLGGSQAPGDLLYILYNNSSVNPPVSSIRGVPAGWTVEWGRLTGAATTWGNDLLAGPPDAGTGRIPGTYTNQRAAAQDCGEALQAAGDLEFSTTPVADGWNLDSLLMMRVTPPNGTMDPLSSAIFIPKLVTRTAFLGAPNDGVAIPQGTTPANFSNAHLNTTTYPANTYDPNTHTNVGVRNDRLVVQLVSLSITKTADVPTSAPGTDDLLQVDAGDSVLWSIRPVLTGAVADAVATDVRVVDTLPRGTDVDPSCMPPPPAGVTYSRAEVILAGVPRVQVTWSFGDRTPVEALPRLVLCTTTDATSPSGTDITNAADVLAGNVRFVPSLHRDDRSIRLFSPGGVRAQMGVDRTLDLQDDDQVWNLRWANLSDAAVAGTDTIFVFPFVGDAAGGAARDTYASDYVGALQLTAALAAPKDQGGVDVAGTWRYTSAASASLSHAANDPSNQAGGTTTWCTVAQFGDPGCPASIGEATGARFVQSGPFAPGSTLSVDVPLQADGNAAGDLYVGRFGTYTPTFGSQPIISNEPYVQVLGFVLGDLIWIDTDQNGTFDDAVDATAPVGTKVEVWQAGGAGTKVADTTVDADGRWFVDGLPSGQYWAVIPASEFAIGGPLAGYLPSAPGFSSDPDADENESDDHHAIADPAVAGAVRSSGLLTLSATVGGTGITGDEPVGDDVALLAPALVGDTFTNMTLDLALVESSSIQVAKVIVDPAPWDANGDATTFPVTVECTGPTGAPAVQRNITIDRNGTPTIVPGLYPGASCAVTETGTDGGTATYAPATPVIVTAGQTVSVTITNTFPEFPSGSITLTKAIVDPADWDDLGDDPTFPVTVSCTGPGTAPAIVRNVTIARDGTPTVVAGLYAGSSCTVTETGTDGGTVTYDPATPVTVLDGQTVGVAVTNTYPEFPTGSITLTKTIVDPAPWDGLGDADEFPVTVSCTGPGDAPAITRDVTIARDGTPTVVAGLYAGSECTVTETDADGGIATYAPATPVTVGDGTTTTVAITNTYPEAPAGSITLHKELVDPNPADGAGDADTFTVAVACTGPDGAPGYATEVELDRDGTEVSVDGLLVGATCELTETEADGGTGVFSPGSSIEITGADTVEVTLTNTFPDAPPVTPTTEPIDIDDNTTTPTVPGGGTSNANSSGSLPRTGTEIGSLVAASLVLLGLGALVLRGRRRFAA